MALKLLAANNAQTVLSAGISSSATTLTVNTGTGALFPAPVSGTSFYKLTLVDAATGQLTEIMHVTARTGDVMTVLRAQEGTTARAWSANDIAANMLTSGSLSFFAQNESPTFTGAPLAPTPSQADNSTKIATTAFVAGAITANPGRLVSIKKFTSSGTYTPTAGTRFVKVRLVGAGGAGGGAAASTVSGYLAAGRGGGGGSYGETTLIDVTSVLSVAVIVGSAGVGSAGSSGTGGGSSSFGSYITAPGGDGGGMGASGPANNSLVSDLGNSGKECTGTDIFISIPGEGGGGQMSLSTGTAKGGHGGSSILGTGGSAYTANQQGGYGWGFGAGGAGSVAVYAQGTSATAGGHGSNGIVIIEEYA
ncbi:glycine-rich domain-containing protein [Enterobacter kobei]|uniref:glycine-rich domain-containing protein n=1 Tax=Enterobacter kobei TaxID=208224 RepID=UPI00388EDC3A